MNQPKGPTKPGTPGKPAGKPMGKSAERGYHLREKIQASIDIAQEEKRRSNFLKRIDLARNGVRSYQLHRIGEAARSFHTYIRILEDWKGVAEGGLNPRHFDAKKDLSELLLISGVYWDLAKLYDRTQSKGKQKEFLHYLEKFILFSKGMSYEALSAETLRRYIAHNKSMHRSEFRNAYRILSGSSCFVATALADVCEEDTVPRLRRFRDERLSRSSPGRGFIRWYYRFAPSLAVMTDRLPQPARRLLGLALTGAVRLLTGTEKL